jgi:SAM-dependent methyltransferase
MLIDASSFFRHAAIRNLFDRELAALAPILAGVYGTTGLFLRAHPQTPARLPANLLGTIHALALDDDRRLRGSLVCAPDELPLASESCKLVIVQHLLERLGDDADGCAGEIARVLAPEGVLLVLGFNPASLWRAWLGGKARGAKLPLRLQSAARCRSLFIGNGIDVLQTRHLGPLSPWSGPSVETSNGDAERTSLLASLRGGWLLLARKRRNSLMPLRLKRDSRDLVRNPRLAPGAHRECA